MDEIQQLMDKHFGPQPSGLFLAIGRLSALTSLLDVWVRHLLATLVDDEPMCRYDNLGFYDHKKLIKQRADLLLPPDLRKDARQLLGTLTGLRGDRNAGVHTVWSEFGFGWRNDPKDPQKALTFAVDQDTIEAKVLKAARLVDQLVSLQERCNRLQVERHRERTAAQVAEHDDPPG